VEPARGFAYAMQVTDTTHIMAAGVAAFAKALEILRGGGVVALPTETVYGLAADARNSAAVAKIYALKGRPAHNPLIAHVLRPDWAADLAHIGPLGQSLIEAFWPGPLTLVLPRKENALCHQAGGWLSTIAVRCPDTPWSEPFIAGGWRAPLFMPSANLSGRISPTRASHVAADFGTDVDLIIDGGLCRGGVESTVLEVHDDFVVLLRPGIIAAEDFAPFVPDLRLPEPAQTLSAPGMLSSHYAPRARVRLNAAAARAGEAHLGFGEIGGELNLSKSGNTLEAARNLYDYLRRLDRAEVSVIAIAPIPHTQLGNAINDRLNRAAADRGTNE